jgi:hypothetical protein
MFLVLLNRLIFGMCKSHKQIYYNLKTNKMKHEKTFISTLDKVTKYTPIIYVPFFIWVFTQIIINL